MDNLKNLNLEGKRVLIRVDYNVPLNSDFTVKSDRRIVETLGFIRSLIQKNAIVILMSHLGRPNGERNVDFSLKPVFDYLSTKLPKVYFADDCIGEKVENAVKQLENGDVLLLENLRFYKGEEDNNEEFAKSLSCLGDIFIDDAFSVSHRKHASNFGIKAFLPSYEGPQLKKEKENLSLKGKEKPILAILGGAKVKDKVRLIKNLLDKVDVLCIGGAMSFAFLKVKNASLGLTKVDDIVLDEVKEILNLAEEKNVKIVLPIDLKVAIKVNDEYKKVRNCNAILVPSSYYALDIGNKTVRLFKKEIKNNRTIFWNGPLGLFENKKFFNGTKQIAKAMAKSKAWTIVGGGDTVSAIEKSKVENKINYISTGGGASLYYLQEN